MRTTLKSNQRAFTLIELLAVVGIIGILASLLLSATSKAKPNAQSIVCKNNFRQMGLALKMYVDEHQSQYPLFASPANPARLGEPLASWYSQLTPYGLLPWTNAASHCPGYKGEIIQGWGSYAYNGVGVVITDIGGPKVPVGLGLGPEWRQGNPKPKAITEAQVLAPSEMFAIGESRFISTQINKAPGGMICMIRGCLDDPRQTFDPARHGKNYNQLFCDGHVSAMDPWTLFDLAKTASMWNNDHKPHPEFWPTGQ